MTPEYTLNVDLNSRVKNSPRYNADSVGEYFKSSQLDWWKPTNQEYIDQENIIDSWLKGKTFSRGLEIGPGFGRITNLIAPNTKQLVLVEINQRANRHLHHNYPLATIVDTNVDNFDLWKGKYDLIAAIEILVHIPNILALLDVVAESLEDNGMFITSITPKELYGNTYTVIHRGIDPEEFEQSLVERELHVIIKTPIGHHITYCITKQKS